MISTSVQEKETLLIARASRRQGALGLAICAVLASCGMSGDSNSAVKNLMQLSTVLGLHKLDHGSYPASLDELVPMAPEADKAEISTLVLSLDQWGNSVTYRYPASSSHLCSYDLYYFGENKRDDNGKADDIIFCGEEK